MNKLKVYLRSYFHLLRYYFTRSGLKKNEELKNKYLGQRCFILCTGASIKEFDLKALKNENVFICNMFYKHPDAHLLKIAGYFEMDPASSHTVNPDPFWNGGGHHREIANFTNMANCPTFLRMGIEEFCRKAGARFKKVYFVQSCGLLAVSRNLRTDLAGKFNMVDGVVYTMLGAAVYMGFKEIYLLGCDYTFYPKQTGHFYEDWVLKEDHQVDERHQKIFEYLKQNGIQIKNIIPKEFQSPVYPGISIEEVVSGVLAKV
jgi:hypothetical protein